MALVAPVEHGKIVETESQNSLAKKSGTSNGMDKDAFLQLLVAQMRYQDPLEPTSNTEYISQYAQFSQVEQMQNMANTMELQRAAALVGKEVYIRTTTSSGDTKYVFGRVDYVTYENGKAYLYINEAAYSLDDLDTVVDSAYQTAYEKAESLNIKLNKLPAVAAVDLSDAAAIEELEELYNSMSDYEKGFVAQDTVNRLNQYIEKLKEVRLAAGLDENGNEIPKVEEPVDGAGDGDENIDGDETVSGSGDVDEDADGSESEDNGNTEDAG